MGDEEPAARVTRTSDLARANFERLSPDVRKTKGDAVIFQRALSGLGRDIGNRRPGST